MLLLSSWLSPSEHSCIIHMCSSLRVRKYHSCIYIYHAHTCVGLNTSSHAQGDKRLNVKIGTLSGQESRIRKSIEQKNIERTRQEGQGEMMANSGHEPLGPLDGGLKGDSSHNVSRKPYENVVDILSNINTTKADCSKRTESESEVEKKNRILTDSSYSQVERIIVPLRKNVHKCKIVSSGTSRVNVYICLCVASAS